MSVPSVAAYTADISICSQICRISVHEHNLSCEHRNIDIECRMENYEAWFVRIQPKMTVPAMQYDDRTLTDSKDIMYFLAEKHPECGRYPEDCRAAVDEYINGFYSRFGLIAAFTFANF